MIIRNCQGEDFSGIVRVIQNAKITDCWPEVYPEGWNEERIKEEFAPLKSYEDSVFLVSEEQGRVTGLIAGHSLEPFLKFEIPHLKDAMPRFLPAFYQRDIIIEPKSQKGSVGIRLFRELAEKAKEAGYKRLVTRTPPQNTRGVRFFKKLGYREILRDNNPERIYFEMKIQSS